MMNGRELSEEMIATALSMLTIPNAKSARGMSDKNAVRKLNEEMILVTGKINEAIELGLYSAEVDFYISVEMKDMLASLGYAFRFGCQCDSPYTIIKW